jgi:hypothetical protein
MGLMALNNPGKWQDVVKDFEAAKAAGRLNISGVCFTT